MKDQNHKSWKVIPIWRGSTCVILGGGPSLIDFDFTPIKSMRIIGVNNAYGDPTLVSNDGKAEKYIPRPWVDVCWFGDERWFYWHREWLKDYKGMLCTCRTHMHGLDGILALNKSRKRKFGIDEKVGQISWNGNSGASAINFAYHLGVRKIILLGYDMKRVNGKTNWHEDHPNREKNPYERFLGSFPAIARDAKKLGLEIINCTPDSALDVFPKLPLEKALV